MIFLTVLTTLLSIFYYKSPLEAYAFNLFPNIAMDLLDMQLIRSFLYFYAYCSHHSDYDNFICKIGIWTYFIKSLNYIFWMARIAGAPIYTTILNPYMPIYYLKDEPYQFNTEIPIMFSFIFEIVSGFIMFVGPILFILGCLCKWIYDLCKYGYTRYITSSEEKRIEVKHQVDTEYLFLSIQSSAHQPLEIGSQ